jgi:dTDP-4-amino-4,6-dideoxygalactose transaminase
MATFQLSAGTPVGPRFTRHEYLEFTAPDMAEAGAVSEHVNGARRPFGADSRATTFEQAFAARVGSAFAVATASRDAALRLALRVLDIKAGDDVVVPVISPVSTANAVLLAGANPLLCDVDPATQMVEPEHIDRVRTARTRAIVVTHLGGRPASLRELTSHAHAKGLSIINDAGLAVDAQHAGVNIARYGTLTVYGSDHSRPGRSREGGLVVTDDPGIADRLIQARRGAGHESVAHARDDETPGQGLRMSAAQASEGLRFLEGLDALSRRRRAIWNRYEEALAGQPVLKPLPTRPGDRHGLGFYTIQVAEESCRGGRDEAALALHNARIGTGVHYRGLHLHPELRDGLGYAAADFPTASRISAQTLSLPLSATMSDRDVEDVIGVLVELLETPK